MTKPGHTTGWDLARQRVVHSLARNAETFHFKGCRFAPAYMQERELTFAEAIRRFRRPCEECIGRRYRFSLLTRTILAILKADSRSVGWNGWSNLR
jgi:hypothetical protein